VFLLYTIWATFETDERGFLKGFIFKKRKKNLWKTYIAYARFLHHLGLL